MEVVKHAMEGAGHISSIMDQDHNLPADRNKGNEKDAQKGTFPPLCLAAMETPRDNHRSRRGLSSMKQWKPLGIIIEVAVG